MGKKVKPLGRGARELRGRAWDGKKKLESRALIEDKGSLRDPRKTESHNGREE